MTTNSAFSSIGYTPGSNGTLNISGAANYSVTNGLNIADANSTTGGDTGVINMTGTGTITTGALFVGKGSNIAGELATSGVLNQSSGTVAAGTFKDSIIGGGNGASDVNVFGLYNLMGGTATGAGNFQIGGYGVGLMTMSGGAFSTSGGTTVIGRYAGSYGVLDVTGGTFTQNAASTALIIGEQGTGILNVRGGTVKEVGTATTGGLPGGLAIGGIETGRNRDRHRKLAGRYAERDQSRNR